MLMACIPAASAQFDPEQLYAARRPCRQPRPHDLDALTLEVNEWADDYPEIVDLTSAGESELGKTLWVVRLSDWSMDTKPNGSAKEIIYIDGGHHATNTSEQPSHGCRQVVHQWLDRGNEEAITSSEHRTPHPHHAQPRGNDIDTRWNINQVDLNRNYNHYWNTCPTQPGSSAFGKQKRRPTRHVNAHVTDADLYVTMHTGVWIILYPWKWPEQPPLGVVWRIRMMCKPMFEIPIQNANQGLYQTAAPAETTATVRWDFPPSPSRPMTNNLSRFENINDRLAEEMDVMRFLIQNVWYWRARLDVQSITSDDDVALEVVNNGWRPRPTPAWNITLHR